MHEDDVPARELLDELLAERFPSWRGVLNEESASRARMKRGRRALADLVGDEDVSLYLPLAAGDNDLVRRARRRLLENLPTDYGYGRQQRPPA